MRAKAINRFLLDSGLDIVGNPCVSPDFCLDWERLREDLRAGIGIIEHEKSDFDTAQGTWRLAENARGDHAWRLELRAGAETPPLPDIGERLSGFEWFPATFENLVALKNLSQEFDPGCEIFPTAQGRLAKSTLGIGARFTTLHWPGVDWAMSNLGIGLTANQNSIPRELVYDVDAMLAGELETVPFPFIGASVPEGHQGQLVEGMSHGCVLAKLKTGFHKRRIPWSFNADHQPIGGKFDAREDRLVAGCLLASYITFDLSPELAATPPSQGAAQDRAYVEAEVGPELTRAVAERAREAGIAIASPELDALLRQVWPAIRKMKARDDKYRRAREAAFSEDVGRAYLRELSIDELPGITEPATTAVMLALCEALDMRVDFIAPAFGFQKNLPYADEARLRELVERQWRVCERFGASIGFHSGSGKSAENYRVLGEITGSNLEIKTSGRYTYEMGVALAGSSDPGDQALWRDWYEFARKMALAGAFSEQATERDMARAFIASALELEGRSTDAFASRDACAAALRALAPSPEHAFWFEYNFLYVLAAEGRADKAALGDHSPAGYRQRARFYAISAEGRLRFAKRVAGYILFLAENAGLAPSALCRAAREKLDAYTSNKAFVDDIAQGSLSAPSPQR